MPARHERYRWRNEQIGTTRVYVCAPGQARLSVDGEEVKDGTLATVVDVFDFDYGFMYELPDGRRTRSGGSSWIRPDGKYDVPVLIDPTNSPYERRRLLFLQYLLDAEPV